MSLGFNLPVHKIELEGNTLFFKEATIADMKAISKLDAETQTSELFKRTYCNESGQKIEVTDSEIEELPSQIAVKLFTFVAEINTEQKKS